MPSPLSANRPDSSVLFQVEAVRKSQEQKQKSSVAQEIRIVAPVIISDPQLAEGIKWFPLIIHMGEESVRIFFPFPASFEDSSPPLLERVKAFHHSQRDFRAFTFEGVSRRIVYASLSTLGVKRAKEKEENLRFTLEFMRNFSDEISKELFETIDYEEGEFSSSLQMRIQATSSVTHEVAPGKIVDRIAVRTGSVSKAYITDKSIYILIDQECNGVVDRCTEVFFASFGRFVQN